MKLLSVLVFLSVSMMGWFMFQAVKQELRLREMRSSFALGSNQMKQKEDRIHQIKMKITELNEQLKTLQNKMDELQKKKQESIKSTEALDLNLQKCNEEKVWKTHCHCVDRGLVLCSVSVLFFTSVNLSEGQSI